ncbi:MAG: stage V sporulation protein K [Bacillaceae bacterium]
MKNNGQINIVINQKTMVEKPKEVVERQVQELASKHDILKYIEDEMSKLVGMEQIKKIIKEVYAWIYINQKREQMGLKSGKQVLHMLFKGNPGTGKTTVARLIGKLLAHMKILSKGHLIEAERADLVGEYIGHTAQKTRELLKKAMGGILFIDEAYSLGRGGERDFGKEAIDTIVKHMEDKQNDFVLILAGYSKEMDHFLTLNSGLQSRFPVIIEFPDYGVSELMEIADCLCKEKEYVLAREAQEKLEEHLRDIKENSNPKLFSNGRYVRNIIEKAIRAQAMRLLIYEKYAKDDLLILQAIDLKFEEAHE